MLPKIVAEDCCQICIQRSEICILRKHQTIPLLKLQKILLGNKSFSRTKKYTKQFICTIYSEIPHLCPVLHAINDQNVILLRASANSLLRSSKVHILLVYKQEVWPPYSAHSSDWVHLSPQQQYITFFSKNRNPIQFHLPCL